VIVRFVGHPKRLGMMPRLDELCRKLDVIFYPTALSSNHYPENCTVIHVHMPSGAITSCISLSTPVMGNIFLDRLELYGRPIRCPSNGDTCACEIHFQQGIVPAAENVDEFSRIKEHYVSSSSREVSDSRLEMRRLELYGSGNKKIGHVSDETSLTFPRPEVKATLGARISAAGK
jgi:hypothetical protein